MRRGILMALGLALLVPAVLSAQRGPWRPRGPAIGARMTLGSRAGPAQMRRLALAFHPQALLQRRGALRLSEEQVTRLEALAAETRSARQALPRTVREHADALRRAWRGETTDVQTIERHASAILEAQRQTAMAAVTASARARALLSAEQRGRTEGWVEGRFGRLGRAGGGGARPRTPRRMPGDARRLRRPR